MLVFKPSVGGIIPFSQVLRYWSNFVKLGLNTPNYVQGHMKSNPKSSAPCFTSNETVLQIRDFQLVSQGTEGLKGILSPQVVQERCIFLLPRCTKNGEN